MKFIKTIRRLKKEFLKRNINIELPLQEYGNSVLAQGFFKGDRGVKITPRILGVTPRFGSAAAAWAIFG